MEPEVGGQVVGRYWTGLHCMNARWILYFILVLLIRTRSSLCHVCSGDAGSDRNSSVWLLCGHLSFRFVWLFLVLSFLFGSSCLCIRYEYSNPDVCNYILLQNNPQPVEWTSELLPGCHRLTLYIDTSYQELTPLRLALVG